MGQFNTQSTVLLEGAAIKARSSRGASSIHFVGLNEKSYFVKITPAMSDIFISSNTWTGATGSGNVYVLETSPSWTPPAELFNWLNANQIVKWETLSGREENLSDTGAFKVT